MSHRISLDGVKWSCLRVDKPALPRAELVAFVKEHKASLQQTLASLRKSGTAVVNPGPWTLNPEP